MDPIIMIVLLWRQFKPRPLAIEHFYYQKGLRFFMELVGALPLPTMDVGNQWKVRRVEKLKAMIHDQLLKGENFLIYPSGRLKSTGDERIGGASLIPDLLNLNPDVNVVLVRTTGLWGSTFSRAITGVSPAFGPVLWNGFKTILKNGIFFTPRREIRVEFTFAPPDLPKRGEKMEINRWLENWYNKYGAEPLKFVSFAFWKEEFPTVTAKEMPSMEEEVHVPEEMKKQILAILSKMTRRPPEELRPDHHLSNDLGLDSLDIAQLNVFLEERFDITGLAPGQLQSVHDIFQAAGGVVKETEAPEPHKKKLRWPHEFKRPDPQIPEGDTIPEVFLKSCERMGDSVACADGLSGVLRYKKLKQSALVLSLVIREMPGENIGILLPSSVASYLCILATLLAGKTPVMLNWTAGFKNLEHAADICKLETVLSSFRFLSRLDNGDLGKVDDLLVLMEEVRRNIPLKTKLKGLFLSWRSVKSILKNLPNLPKKDDPAVIIFTSGTETLPKGVPLSHENILSNQRAALPRVNFLPKDSLYGVLPPFHSFGFSVTGTFPLLCGLKVCFAPDPTDSRSMANDIEHWDPTIFCCAPSFIQSLLAVASKEQLASLRMVVTGAEKAPQEMFDVLDSMGKLVIEGYGISECSPIVTVRGEGDEQKGVGKPLSNIELCVINSETDEQISNDQEGEICIHGPNVFNGYLGIDRNPFIELGGKRWYRSGDRGYIDADGTLILTGRLKRFVKIGGEMVSLGGIEEDLRKICYDKGWAPTSTNGPILAVTSMGNESEKPIIVLFSTFDVDREALNKELKNLGHGRIVKIGEVRRCKEIPVGGTGKTQYRALDEMV